MKIREKKQYKHKEVAMEGYKVNFKGQLVIYTS